MSKKQKRFEVLDQREVNKDGFIQEWVDVGLVAMESPNDPQPGIKIENGQVVELDGKARKDFDMIDTWIADHCIDTSVAEEAMALDSLTVARMLADINVPRDEIIRLSVGMTPAKYVDILKKNECGRADDGHAKTTPAADALEPGPCDQSQGLCPASGSGCRRSGISRFF